jgi:hypothetical protein
LSIAPPVLPLLSGATGSIKAELCSKRKQRNANEKQRESPQG